MDCPARIELVHRDEDGQILDVSYVACTGTLEGPIPNERSNEVESSPMGDGKFGYDWFCATCGQTTVIVDNSITG